MAVTPEERHEAIIAGYEAHPGFGYPVVPQDEQDDWLPLRAICKQLGYDFPDAVNGGWAVRVYDWRFPRLIAERGQASPERLMIHKTLYPDFRIEAGAPVDEVSLLDIGARFSKRLEEANNAYLKAQTGANDEHDAALDAALRAYPRGGRPGRNRILGRTQRL